VLELISLDVDLTLRQRQELTSALRTTAKALGRPPAEVPAHPLYLWERLQSFAPASVGLAEGRWRNVRSLLRSALKRVGLAYVPGRYREPFTPAWEDLFRYLNDRRIRLGLSRLGRYCGAIGIAPDEVNDEVIAKFVADLRENGFGSKAQRIHRNVCMLWNRAAASIDAWPKRQLSVPVYRKTYVLPWSSLPETLKTDFDAYISHLAGGDILEDVDFRPLRPRSLKTRTDQLRQFIAALVHRGHDPQSLCSMANLVPVDIFKEGLRFFEQRAGGRPSKQMFDIACVVKAVAKHWVKVDEQHLARLKSISSNIKLRLKDQIPESGPTRKNRARLRQFKDPANLISLVTLPQRLVSELPKSGKPSRAQALRAQTALAIELLLMVPVRITNLAGLELDRHLIRSCPGNTVSIAIGGEEVKNDVNIEAELPADSVNLLNLYLTRYRPVLIDEPSNWLFPGKHNRKPKAAKTLGGQIAECLKRRCGLDVNPHLFRHIGAMSYLNANPGAYGLMRLVLGHKSVETTTRFYCGLEGPAAMRHFDEHVLKLRRDAGPSPVPATAGRRR
jgi:integrase